MCYSAEVWEDYNRYVRKFGARIDIDAYVKLFLRRNGGGGQKIPKGMELGFANPKSAQEKQIAALIEEFNAVQSNVLQAELFKQKKRLNDAERTLQQKTTRKALNDQRIATDKIAAGLRRLDDLKRTEPKDRDNRIFPLVYAPVMIWEDGQRVIRPMRYQCRPAGKPARYDVAYSGTYNARRDNLEGFWKPQFGHSHGLMVVSTFYENVEGEDGRNQVLQFTPRDAEPMLVACLWSHWVGKDGDELLSFAAITDDPPAEIAAAGHDRCIINIKPEHVDAWLNPDPNDLASLYAIMDDRAQPYYEHRLAA